MKVDVVKIIVLLAPVIKYLLDRKVPKNKINLYNKAAKSNDCVMDSLQELAIKVKTGIASDGSISINDPSIELDKQNLDTGIELIETMIKAYQSRLNVIKTIKGN